MESKNKESSSNGTSSQTDNWWFTTSDTRDAWICYVFTTNSAYFPKLIGPNPEERAASFAKREQNEIGMGNRTDSPTSTRRTTKNPIKTPKKITNTLEPYTNTNRGRNKTKITSGITSKNDGSSSTTSDWKYFHDSAPTVHRPIATKIQEKSSLVESSSTSTSKTIFNGMDNSGDSTSPSTYITIPPNSFYICPTCHLPFIDCLCWAPSIRNPSDSQETKKDIETRPNTDISSGEEERGRAPSQCAEEEKTPSSSAPNNIESRDPEIEEITSKLGRRVSYKTKFIRASFCKECFWRFAGSPSVKKYTPYFESCAACPWCKKISIQAIVSYQCICTSCYTISSSRNFFFIAIDRIRKRNISQTFEREYWPYHKTQKRRAGEKASTEREIRLLTKRCESCAARLFSPDDYYPFLIKRAFEEGVKDIEIKKIQNAKNLTDNFYNLPETQTETTISGSYSNLHNSPETQTETFLCGSDSNSSTSSLSGTQTTSNQIEAANQGIERSSNTSGILFGKNCSDQFDSWGKSDKEDTSRNDRTVGSECTQSDDISGLQKIFQTIPREDIELGHFTATDSRTGSGTSKLFGSIEPRPEGETQRNELPSRTFCERPERSELDCSSTGCERDGNRGNKNETKESFTSDNCHWLPNPKLSEIQQKTDEDGSAYWLSKYTYDEPKAITTNQETDRCIQTFEPTPETTQEDFFSSISYEQKYNTASTPSTSCVKFIVEVNLRTGEEKRTEFEKDYDFIDHILGKYYVKMIIKELWQ
jgi:hypothetical protein